MAIDKFITPQEEARYKSIIDNASKELQDKGISRWHFKPKDAQTAIDALAEMSDKDRVKFLYVMMAEVDSFFTKKKRKNDDALQRRFFNLEFLSHVLKSKLRLDDEDVELLVQGFLKYRVTALNDITGWPLKLFVTAVEKSYKNATSKKASESLKPLKAAIEKYPLSNKETIKLVSRIDTILFHSSSGGLQIKPTFFLGKDEFTPYANKIIESQPEKDRETWYKVLQLAQKASGSKPSAKFLEQSHTLIKELQSDKFKKVVVEWLHYLAHLKDSYQEIKGKVRTYKFLVYLDKVNAEAVKGLVWMCSHFHDSHTLSVIAALCERSYKKIPGEGPAAASVGNACLFALYKSKGLEGISHLSRLKLRIKQSNTQDVIEKYLREAADSHGVSVSEVEDLAVGDFDLKNGKLEYTIGEYTATLSIESVGDVQIAWTKQNQSPLKSVPAAIKDKYGDKLKKIKETAKQIETSLTAQRDRIDRMFRSRREMSWSYFDKHYFSHGLLSFLTKNIIWRFRTRKVETDALFLRGKWITLQGGEFLPDQSTMVSLWHPALATAEEVRAWRKLLIDEQIRQPVKQAFREVYIVTDAEIKTRIYSNRMAAHIMKQHQFSSLAKMRGWKYSLIGTFDDDRFDNGAELHLPDANLKAEFWVNEVNAEDEHNDVGIWNYVSTDQVRFVELNSGHAVELISVPRAIFSEAMRDIDLFVGVASIGNDPAWVDNGGVPAYRDYWRSYSFGELTEIAKTRRDILESLVPRLKIASVSTIRDKFLVVKGKRRTYKIHIGSTNILMEPNDQYLCIVPGRSNKITSNLYLPFEGDAGLSVILSKAILLANDDQITDPTILSQINRS